ncbi:MAG: RcnB family protein [Betaproteobacteria bacterium]
MPRLAKSINKALILLIAAALSAGPALADKPEWAGGGKEKHGGGKNHQAEGPGKAVVDGEGAHVPVKGYFNAKQEAAARQYFRERARSGHCPPGLAKKNNGCLPPGQAKKWAVGEPLPHDVVTYNIPPRLVVKLGTPPAGYRYVRVATDILLIAIGTGMVVDAIQDLGGL